MGKQSSGVAPVATGVAPGIARVVGLLLVPIGFALLVIGVTAYVGHLDSPDTDGRPGLVRGGAGVLVLALGMVWLDRGFGRGARPL
ncbi:hypothetical protein, partial [Nocardioides sp.]|uniref:hypothetical protein n=1 Tax=Nocardioides sp. TaxID=35761 RepID=UPI00273456D5